ncbi:MAG: hypothetical protein A3B70_01185 [Deltaproteobacteria bacterium RIFCSPHIGHO2_02_FULL_40_11]|nr:MAG: hypothetical protein A3B70_01185 [Deltaproteobacteria bacterium RIFCSPHIGHO2_02_FULL_40_11]
MVFVLLGSGFYFGKCFLFKPKVKNIILMIGDGMGPQQIALAMQYAKQAPHSTVSDRTLNLEKLSKDSYVGLMTTYTYENLVTDSAASATQLSTGKMSRSEIIGIDFEGNPQEVLVEKAKKIKMATGLVTNTRVTHATPAAFAAHVQHRGMENDIATQLLELQPDIMLGGGLRHFLPQSLEGFEEDMPSHLRLKSKRKDDLNLLKQAKSLGYDLTFSKQDLQASTSNKILGLFATSEHPDAIEIHAHANDTTYPTPNLKEMTQKALDVLSKNKNGFFLMVEGGQIDYAGHYNDAGWLLHEMLDFDEAIGAVYEWTKNRKDTLVIITADHETGGFGFSYSKNDIPEPKPLPGKAFEGSLFSPLYNFGNIEVLDQIYTQKKSFATIFDEFDALPENQQRPSALQSLFNEASEFKISLEQAKSVLMKEPNMYYRKGHKYLDQKEWPVICDFKEFFTYGDYTRLNLLARAIAKDQQVVWATGTHTSTAVAVIAWGPKAVREQFSGIHHSTQIGQLIGAQLR